MLSADTARYFDRLVRLRAPRCGACDRIVFPPRSRCPTCGGAEFSEAELPRIGLLENFTVGSATHDERTVCPAAIGIVRLDDGQRLLCPLTGDAAVRPAVGMHVMLVVRRWKSGEPSGENRYGYAAAPATDADAVMGKDDHRE